MLLAPTRGQRRRPVLQIGKTQNGGFQFLFFKHLKWPNSGRSKKQIFPNGGHRRTAQLVICGIVGRRLGNTHTWISGTRNKGTPWLNSSCCCDGLYGVYFSVSVGVIVCCMVFLVYGLSAPYIWGDVNLWIFRWGFAFYAPSCWRWILCCIMGAKVVVLVCLLGAGYHQQNNEPARERVDKPHTKTSRGQEPYHNKPDQFNHIPANKTPIKKTVIIMGGCSQSMWQPSI